ncbi:MAG: RsmE family RNA methyltransferase [Actinomycetota bacterium]
MSYAFFFVNPNDISGNTIVLRGQDYNHLANALRAKTGDIVEVSDNSSYRYTCRIAEIRQGKAVLEAKKREKIKRISPQITLFQCIIKKNAMEYLIQKATEIGIDKIIPVMSKRVVVDKKILRKAERWNKIAESASKQSGRSISSKVLAPVSLEDIQPGDYDLFFIPYEQKKERNSFADALKHEQARNIGYLIGPEGGFETGEVDLLIKKGAQAVSLGKNILRSETAAIYFLSVMDYLLKT